MGIKSAVEELREALGDEGMEKPIRGLGDVVSRVTKALGIKECSGCAKRRERLNQLLPLGDRRRRGK